MLNRLTILILLTAILQSCGEGSIGSSSSDGTVEKKFYASGVKLIAKDITDPRDPSSMQQNSYVLNNDRRLLTRLEGMNSRAGAAVVTGDTRMYVVVSSPDFIDNKPTFETAMEICPLTVNWMMLATWDRAHPFPTNDGRWERRGGDFSTTDCVLADTSYENQRADSLYFDVSDWYLFYVRSRGRNYGLMIMSSEEVTVYGDEDSQRAPHFVWRE